MRSRLLDLAVAESLVIVLGSVYAGLMLVTLPAQVGQDTWLALVGGRSVAHSGIPGADTLTSWTLGVDWVDQQWLGQLGLYGLHSSGGLKLALLVLAVVAIAAYGMALGAARWRGGSQRMVLRIGLLALIPIALVSFHARNQTFGYLFFVAILWLLMADSRRPSWRVLWVFALLALWANVHGSVTLGAAVVGFAGVVFLVEGMRSQPGARSGHVRHGAVLVAAAVIAPFVSPYGLSLLTYYDHTLFNSDFAQYVSEWRRATPSPVTAPFYALAALCLWLLGRAGGRLTLFERGALLLTLVAGVLAIRNIVWFCLAATMLLPVTAEVAGSADTSSERSVPTWLSRGLPIASVAAVAALFVYAAARPLGDYLEFYPSRAADSVWQAAQRDPQATVFADETYADWLLWRHPGLAGRVLFDARFELLSTRQFRDSIAFKQHIGDDWQAAAADSPLLVLNPHVKPTLEGRTSTVKALEGTPGTRILYRSGDLAVLLRPSR